MIETSPAPPIAIEQLLAAAAEAVQASPINHGPTLAMHLRTLLHNHGYDVVALSELDTARQQIRAAKDAYDTLTEFYEDAQRDRDRARLWLAVAETGRFRLRIALRLARGQRDQLRAQLTRLRHRLADLQADLFTSAPAGDALLQRVDELCVEAMPAEPKRLPRSGRPR